ncbi:MAG: glycosyltransferase [Bdellovibrionales bacterium]
MNSNSRKPLQIAYIVPVHNDAESLHLCIEQLQEQTKTLPNTFTVLVENGSQDSSFQVAHKLANESSMPIHVFSEKNAGIGYAYHRGMEEALKIWDQTSDLWMILTASDLPFTFSDLRQFLTWYKSHSPLPTRMAMGSKAHPRSVLNNSFSRRLMTGTYRLARKTMLGMKTKDSQGSVFLHATLAKELLPKIASRNFFYSTELVYYAEQKGEVVEELPVVIAEAIRPSTVRPLKDGSRMFLQIMELKKRNL